MTALASAWPASMLAHPFMRHAFTAGTAIAIACGVAGYFLVVRSQVFTGDALSHAAFTGALAALAAGVDLRIGLFVVTVAVAVAMGMLGRDGRADDVVIGTVFVFVLGLGVLFLSIFVAGRSGGGAGGAAGVTVLFGSIFGLSGGDVGFIAIVCAAVAGALLAMARPLMYASLTGEIAIARGVPVRGLGVAFIGLVGMTAAATTQAVGALLLLGLIAGPAAAAHRLQRRPFAALALSPAIAVVVTWSGLVLSYEVHKIPPSFGIIACAALAHAGSYVLSPGRHAG